MKFIRLDYVDPGFYIKGLTQRGDGRKTFIGKMIDKFTMTVDDVISFVGLFSAEFLATFILLGIGCAALSRWDQHIHDFPRSMAFGLVTLICVEIFGWISGAHMNPTVSIAAFISGKLSFQKFLCYFVAQVLGGLCGYGCLVIIRIKEYLDNKCEGTCITLPHIVKDEQAFGIEFIASVLLAWYCCSVWDKQNQDIHESISIRIGFVMIALIFVTGFYTGGSLNPVRSFIPALFHECWSKHWIYWAGPLAGAIIGALLHDLFWRVDLWFGKKAEDDELPTRFSNQESTTSRRSSTMHYQQSKSKNRTKCALSDFSENLMKLFGVFWRKKNKVKNRVEEYEQPLFLRNKKIFYDGPLSYNDSCPIKEIVLSKQPQQQKQQQPKKQGQYQLQPLQQPQLQTLEQPQLQPLQQPQLQSLEQPQPNSLEQPQPQALEQPQSLEQLKPQSIELLQPQSLEQPQPELLEKLQPQPGPAPKTKVDKSIQVKFKADKSTQVKYGSERDLDEDRALLGGKKRPSTPKSPRSPRSPRSPKRSEKKLPPPAPPPLQQDNISEKGTSDHFRRFGDEDASYPSGNWMIAGSPPFYSYKKGKKFRTIGSQTSFYDF